MRKLLLFPALFLLAPLLPAQEGVELPPRKDRGSRGDLELPKPVAVQEPTPGEEEAAAATTGRKLPEAAGITARDYSFENMYDGYGMFHLIHVEGLGYAGIKQGDGLDFFEDADISVEGPHPISPSGGNIGSGRPRFWLHVDSIQQLQGRAGKRQITGVKPEIGVDGANLPYNFHGLVWGANPD